MTQTPEQENKIKSIIDEFSKTPEFANIKTLYEAKKISAENLLELGEILESKPEKLSVSEKLLSIVSSEYVLEGDILTHLLKDRKSENADLKSYVEDFINNIHTKKAVLTGDEVKEYLEKVKGFTKKKAEDPGNLAFGTEGQVREALEELVSDNDTNWKYELDPSLSELTIRNLLKIKDLSAQFKMEDEKFGEFIKSNASDAEKEAQNKIHKKTLDEINKKIEALNQEIIAEESKFEQEGKDTMSGLMLKRKQVLQASQNVGFDLDTVKKLKLGNGKKISIYKINPPGKTGGGFSIQILDENGRTQLLDLFRFISNYIEDKKAVPILKDKKQLLSSLLNIDSKGLNEGDSFVGGSGFNIEGAKEGFPFKIQIKKISERGDGKIVLENKVPVYGPDSEEKGKFTFGEFAQFFNLNDCTRINDIIDLSDENEEEPDDKKASPIDDKDFKSKFNEFQKNLGIEKPDYIVVPPKFTTLSRIKAETYWYSLNDSVKFFKMLFEYIEGNMQNASDFRVGTLGETLGKDGGFKQHAKYKYRKKAEGETKDDIEKIIKSKVSLGPQWWNKILRGSLTGADAWLCQDADALEITADLMAERGLLNLWDYEIWGNIFEAANYLDKDGNKIKIDKNMDPQSTEAIKMFNEFKTAVDKFFDFNTFSKWERSNESNYNDAIGKATNNIAQIATAAGGHVKQLEKFRELHKEDDKGEYKVDPIEYEALIIHGCEAEKMSSDEVMYYIIKGLTELNEKTKKPILTFDRAAQIQKKLGSKKLPFLTILTASITQPGKLDGVDKRPLSRAELVEMNAKFDAAGKPPEVFKAVQKLMWDEIITHPAYPEFSSLLMSNPQDINKDESFYIMPLASEQDVMKPFNITGRAPVAEEGFARAVPGFSQLLKTLADKVYDYNKKLENPNITDLEKKVFEKAKENYVGQIRKTIKTYVRYEALATSRYNGPYQRLSSEWLNKSGVGPESMTAQEYFNELNEMVANISNVFGGDLKGRYSKILKHSGASNADNKVIDDFGNDFDSSVDDSENDKLVEIIRKSNLTGLLADKKGKTSSVNRLELANYQIPKNPEEVQNDTRKSFKKGSLK